MNIIIDKTWQQGSLVNIEDLRGLTFQAESQAHTFRISAVDAAGSPITLSGTPSGVMLRPDNTDVTLTCAVSDGKVTATLPAECYDVPGRVGIAIYLTSNSQKVCIYSAIGSVARTSSGTASPGTTQSVVDLVNAIEAAIAQIPATDTNLKGALAPTYSDSAVYAVGQYAWYDGKLYRCTTAITSGETWTSGHWTEAKLAQDVCELKSALDFIYSDNLNKYNVINFIKSATIGFEIESVLKAGTYTFSYSNLTSTDTDNSTSNILFYNGDTLVDTVGLPREENKIFSRTFATQITKLILYAGHSYADSIGDTVTLTGFNVYSESELGRQDKTIKSGLKAIKQSLFFNPVAYDSYEDGKYASATGTPAVIDIINMANNSYKKYDVRYLQGAVIYVTSRNVGTSNYWYLEFSDEEGKQLNGGILITGNNTNVYKAKVTVPSTAVSAYLNYKTGYDGYIEVEMQLIQNQIDVATSRNVDPITEKNNIYYSYSSKFRCLCLLC